MGQFHPHRKLNDFPFSCILSLPFGGKPCSKRSLVAPHSSTPSPAAPHRHLGIISPNFSAAARFMPPVILRDEAHLFYERPPPRGRRCHLSEVFLFECKLSCTRGTARSSVFLPTAKASSPFSLPLRLPTRDSIFSCRFSYFSCFRTPPRSIFFFFFFLANELALSFPPSSPCTVLSWQITILFSRVVIIFRDIQIVDVKRSRPPLLSSATVSLHHDPPRPPPFSFTVAPPKYPR